MNTLQVCLRDLSTSPCKFLVEVNEKDKFESPIEDEDLCDASRALAEFARQAELVTPPHDNVDVYIGWLGNQDTFEIPKAFFDLITKRGWRVTFDIND